MTISTAFIKASVPHGRLILWTTLAAILLAPAFAMQMTEAVRWGGEDFLAAALLLGGTGIGIEAAARMPRSPLGRLFAGCGVVAVCAILWAQAAVGIV